RFQGFNARILRGILSPGERVHPPQSATHTHACPPLCYGGRAGVRAGVNSNCTEWPEGRVPEVILRWAVSPMFCSIDSPRGVLYLWPVRSAAKCAIWLGVL